MKLYRCLCNGCQYLVTVPRFTCLACFIYCDHDVNLLSSGHYIRIRRRR